MIKPNAPENELQRLEDLNSYSILDTLSEEDYNNLTAIAAEICNTKVSLITFIDKKRQWFKSHEGLKISETPREYSFCAHALNKPEEVLIIQDARRDERFHDNPFVTGDPYVIFYAGVPLISEAGFPLGTLCVVDDQPKLLSQSQLSTLKALSKQVMNLLELRKKKLELEKALVTLEEKNHELENFAMVAAHDLKSPLNTITNIIDLLLLDYKQFIDSDGQGLMDHLKQSAARLRKLIEGLLEYSRSEKIVNEKRAEIDLKKYQSDIEGLFVYDHKCKITLKHEIASIFVNRAALDQVMINLITNAIKYNDKEVAEIEIGVSENNGSYEFYVKDNGPGISPEHHDKIFKIFEIIAAKDKFGQRGNGIGLATVKKMIERQGGSIRVESEKGAGTKFIFTIKK
ncbi:MAG: ATP-binding protein [Bacteroidia bacterium]